MKDPIRGMKIPIKGMKDPIKGMKIQTNQTNMKTQIDWKQYEKRVKELENEGLCTSDAQSVADIEFAEVSTPTDRPSGATLKKHTPGPWTLSGCTVYAGNVMLAGTYCEGNRELHPVICDEELPDSAGVHGNGWDEAGANAALIAAAPDLLQVARDYVLLCQLHDIEGAVLDSALAAIARVEGRAK